MAMARKTLQGCSQILLEWPMAKDRRGKKIESLDDFGIAPARLGRYKTACGKGHGDGACAHGEPDYLKLSNAAIDMFAEESSDWIFYWDSAGKTFRRIQMSD